MFELIDRRSRTFALLSVLLGTSVFVLLELREEPTLTIADIVLEMLEIVPLVVAVVGVTLLAQVAARQRLAQRELLEELEVTRLQGLRWRSEARALLDGLGDAIEAQFARWSLTDAEREVALLLLKGLSLKEIAAIRSTTERTIRAQAQALYAKGGLTGRAALSAFFLEDLLAPIRASAVPARGA